MSIKNNNICLICDYYLINIDYFKNNKINNYNKICGRCNFSTMYFPQMFTDIAASHSFFDIYFYVNLTKNNYNSFLLTLNGKGINKKHSFKFILENDNILNQIKEKLILSKKLINLF